MGYPQEKTSHKRYNPRRANGSLRNKHRARFKAMALPCARCGGVIHYDEPSDSAHPLSFVIDERLPVSRWKEFGYSSAKEAAQDWNNLQPCHYICNQRKGARVGAEMQKLFSQPAYTWQQDGDW